jgi:hypothetical protein
MNATHLIIFTSVDLLNFIFRLGVVFAIYGFLWGLIDFGIRLLTARRQRATGEIYLLKGVKYVILSAVTFLFCVDVNNDIEMKDTSQIVLAGIILLTYFMGKFQTSQNKNQMFKVMGNVMPNPLKTQFNSKAEILVISLALVAFAGFFFYPQIADNSLSEWFVQSIQSIEKAAIIGFIFQIIGFFFLLSMISKMVKGVTFIMNGGKPPKGPQNPFDQDQNQNQNQNNDTGFDDYTEIT